MLLRPLRFKTNVLADEYCKEKPFEVIYFNKLGSGKTTYLRIPPGLWPQEANIIFIIIFLKTPYPKPTLVRR